MRCKGLPPVVPQPADLRVLILGSMPSLVSLHSQAYYAHPRNQFWPILRGALGMSEWPDVIEERYELLTERGIGLWDVIAECHRTGSLDSAIKAQDLKLNPVLDLLVHNASTYLIVCNGQKSGQLFKRYFAKELVRNHPNAQWVVLPSTSPAHATLSFANKNQAWQDKLSNFR